MEVLESEHSVPGYARDTAREQIEELYDLDADIGETANVAARIPAIVGELRSLLDAIERRRTVSAVTTETRGGGRPAASRLGS